MRFFLTSHIIYWLNSQEVSSLQVFRTKFFIHLSLPCIRLVHDLSVYGILLDCVILVTVGEEYNSNLLITPYSAASPHLSRKTLFNSLFSNFSQILTQPLSLPYIHCVQESKRILKISCLLQINFADIRQMLQRTFNAYLFKQSNLSR